MLSARIPIRICPKQLAALANGSPLVARGNIVPDLYQKITGFPNVDDVDRVTKEKTIRFVEVPEHVSMFGVLGRDGAYTKIPVVNRGPKETKINVTEPVGASEKQERQLPVGEKADALFEGSFTASFLKVGGRPIARFGFNRYILSNFMDLDAVEIFVDGTDHKLKGRCVEFWFQVTKALLTDDLSVLESALSKKSCPDLKKLMRDVKVPDVWFNAPEGQESLNIETMKYLQAWCITCPNRHSMICELMFFAMRNGVAAEDVYFYEYSDDTTYGAAAIDGDFAPLLEENYIPKGKNVLGPIISALARQAIKGTHADYVNWFRANYPSLFVLNNPAQEDEDSVLGARTASEADLEAPSGRTPSNGRSLSQQP